MIAPFEIGSRPALVFGEGTLARVPDLCARFGRRALLVTGRASFRGSVGFARLTRGFEERGISWDAESVAEEPSPELVDSIVARRRGEGIEVVVGVGGGSVLDAAKAAAGLLRTGRPVLDHLEIVGRGIAYEGPSTPFLAVPTTAGTGTEATRNAVLSRRGEGGYKRSFRHDELTARFAVVDPELLEGCPRDLIAADGMDALTQLLEAYVSSKASPWTDALAESGLAAVRDGLFAWIDAARDPRVARAEMAWASHASGVCLAHAGLGAVHGLAPPLGSFFPAPHGVVCGALVASATAVNLAALRRRSPDSPALAKYARAGEILSGERGGGAGAADALVDLLEAWTERLGIPRLGRYGVSESDLSRVVADSRGGAMRTNPIVLDDEEVAEIIRRRI